MSVQNEIDRITQNVVNTYAVLGALGAELPEEQNSDNLATTAGTTKALLYSEQSLTEEQQSQARENIGAVSDENIKDNGSDDFVLEDSEHNAILHANKDGLKTTKVTAEEMSVGGKPAATQEYVDIRVPAWTSDDEGKFLRLVDGVPAWVTFAVITFTVDGAVYTAEAGMTWREWVDSGYNTASASIHSASYAQVDYVQFPSSSFVGYSGTEQYVTADYAIRPYEAYILLQGVPGEDDGNL